MADFWCVKRDTPHHYFQVTTGIYVEDTTEATRFLSRRTAFAVAKMIRSDERCTDRIFVVGVTSRRMHDEARAEREAVLLDIDQGVKIFRDQFMHASAAGEKEKAATIAISVMTLEHARKRIEHGTHRTTLPSSEQRGPK